MTYYYQAKSWVATPARIVSTRLQENHSDDGTSYTVLANYEYEFKGRTYTCDRVSLATGFESDRYDRKRYNEFKRLRDSGKTTTCYVDPFDPSRALLDRKLRASVVLFHLPFVICFNLVGFGIGGWAIYAGRRDRRRLALLEAHPDEPWRVRDDWAAGEIRSSNFGSLLATGVFTLLWNGLSMPIFAIVLIGEQNQPWWVVLLVGLFPLIGVGMLFYLLRDLLRCLRFGRATLRLAQTPGVVGGELAGVVLVPESLRSAEEFRLKLECLRSVTRKDADGDSRTVNESAWEDERLVERTLADRSGKRGVPVRFTIPSDARETDPDADPPIRWRLSVSSELAGPDFGVTFDVPVFLTEDSRDGVVVTESPLTDYEREVTLEEAMRREGVRVERPAGDALLVSCPPGRHLLTGLSVGVLGLVFIGVATGLVLYLDEWVKWVFAPVAGLIGLVMAYIGADALLTCSELEVSGDRWRLRSGWFGLRGEESFSAGEVRAITTKQWMTSQSGSEPTKKWNHLVARLKGSRKLTLVRGLQDRSAEAMLLSELRQRAGLEKAEPAEPEDFLDVPIDGDKGNRERQT